ncbi:hypothetical protein [Campylobacter devanensis]|uniref:hypothetical protein n=1 Tax=Campylobacter devanensis TaxID=3161138 RepID=UPI000A338FC4|nr:hypothetical protein [Campylobacter sp. P0222]
MGLFSSDDVGTISPVGFGNLFSAMAGISLSSSPSEPDLDLDEKRRQMNAMIETQNKKMKNLSLNDKYKLDDSKEFFAKLGKEKR